MQLYLFEELLPRTDLDLSGQTCKECKETKKWDQFHYNRSNATRFDTICKTCSNVAREERRVRRRDNLHTITDVCECCKKPSTKSLVLDHCHTTGEIRGWLCTNCNTSIGHLGDDIQGIENALDYLKRSKEIM